MSRLDPSTYGPFKVCVCGTKWATHGRYSTCPRCAKGAPQQRDATPVEAQEAEREYREMIHGKETTSEPEHTQ